MTECTPYINVRAMEPEDLDALYTIENDMEVWGVGVTNVPYSRYVLRDYIANASNDIYADRQVRMIVDNKAGDTVGVIDLINFNPQHRRAEVGIVVRKEYRRKGYAFAALRFLTDYARRILHLNQLYVVVDEQNRPSISLFHKMGFSDGKTLENWLYDGEKYRNAMIMQFFL